MLPDSLYEMLPGKITSVGCISLGSTAGHASPQACSSTAFDIPSTARTFASLACRCLISCCGATGHPLLPESHPVARTSSLCLPDSLVPAPLLHHSAISTFLLLSSQFSPRQCHNAGRCLSHTSDQIPNLEELPQKIYCLPWTNMHYPHAGLGVDWAPHRILGLWTGGSRILTEETSNENALAGFWQDAVLLWERPIGQG